MGASRGRSRAYALEPILPAEEGTGRKEVTVPALNAQLARGPLKRGTRTGDAGEPRGKCGRGKAAVGVEDEVAAGSEEVENGG